MGKSSTRRNGQIENQSCTPVLRSPELNKQFEVKVDASGFAIILLQHKEDNKKHPIAYYSETLSAAEHNYDIYELEYLAIHRACMHALETILSRISTQGHCMV